MNPFYQETMATIYCGNALEVLKEIPDKSVQMCMCSPPYWGLRNYSGGSGIVWGGSENCAHKWENNPVPGEKSGPHGPSSTIGAKKAQNDVRRRTPANTCSLCGAFRGQLGLEPTPELYVEHLMMIFRELKRVLADSGSFYLNIGDTFSGSGMAAYSGGVAYSPKSKKTGDANGYPPPRGKIGLPAGCMVCIPERVLFAMIEDGWRLRNKIIWHKPNNMPSSVKSRFTTTWEYLYLFTKNSTKTLLWRNRETGEWRDTKPTKEENYPYGMRDEEGNKQQPLWMGFSYYFELDSVRQPHQIQSLERYQRGVNLGLPAEGKSAEVGPMQEYTRAPQWFMFPPDSDYKGKFDDLFGHGPQPQSFNLRVRDVKRGKGGATAQSGELKATKQEVEEYEYPEKHHGSSMSNQVSLHRERTQRQNNIINHFEQKGSGGHYLYGGLESPEGTHENPKGKNPGDLWNISTKPSSISVCPQCDAVFPRLIKVCPNCKVEGVVGHFAPYPEALCEVPIKASSREGDIVLDIFAGGGSTGVVAKRLGRRAILIDCVRSYCVMAKYKLSKMEYQPELLNGSIDKNLVENYNGKAKEERGDS